MGTQVTDGTASAPVTMDDLKELKEFLTSSMAAEMKEMREMMTRFMAAQKVDPPLPEESDEDSAAAKAKANVSAEATSEAAAKAAEDPREGKKHSSSNTKGKPEYKEESYVYSPNPLVPHPHVNHRGDRKSVV